MTEPTRTQNVYLFAGGGTGGHLYPGLAIAAELRRIDPSCRCVFLCSDRAIDAKILDAEGAERVVIPAKPPTVRPVGLMKFALSWGRSIRAARGVMVRVRDEARASGAEARLVMAAMGGFVAAPAVQAARAERVPVVLVNLDAVPGKANRWIAEHAAARLTATGPAGEGSRVPSAWEAIAPIVRGSVIARESREACRLKLGLEPAKPLLFVTGGSQGAGSINALMLALARERAAELRGWQVFHQCGSSGEEELRSAYAAAGVSARVVPFWNDMASAWGAAELAVSRCGAGAVAEVWANAVPTVFLPYPYHKDEHQRINALPLEHAPPGGGAVIVRDEIDAGKNLASAGAGIVALLGDAPRREAMRRALRALGPANGAAAAALRLHQAALK